MYTPEGINKDYEMNSFPHRMFNVVIQWAYLRMENRWYLLLPGKGFTIRDFHNIMFGAGAAPMSEPIQHTQAVELFYPMTKFGSKYHEKFTSVVLADEYKQFLDQYDKVVMIAFGTSFIPEKEDLLKLVDLLQDPSFKNVGFILGLRQIEA